MSAYFHSRQLSVSLPRGPSAIPHWRQMHDILEFENKCIANELLDVTLNA